MHGYGDYEVAEMLRKMADWYESLVTADILDEDYPKLPFDEEVLTALSIEFASLANDEELEYEHD